MAATPAWLASIEALLNRGIAASPPAADIAARLNGTVLRLEVSSVATVLASIDGNRLALRSPDDGPGETALARDTATISGSPLSLLNLARGGTRRSGAAGAAQVHGDAEIAALYGQLFALAKPDVEEELAALVGDVPARRLSQLAAQTFGWARRARRTLGENVTEYLQEESRDLVNGTELEEFLQGVDALREMADRVEARLSRLEQRLKGPG